MFLVGMGKLLEREQLPDAQVLNSKKNLVVQSNGSGSLSPNLLK